MSLKVDKTFAASVALHVLVIGGSMLSFAPAALVNLEESLPVEIISADALAKVTQGVKSGAKESKAPVVEKVAEAKPVEDLHGKITEKPPVKTEAAPPPPPPMPPEKPVEKKPEPPKPVAEAKPKVEAKPDPKPEPKPVEKKPEPPKIDPIAEALKRDDSKKPPPPKPVEAAKPPAPKPVQTAKPVPTPKPSQDKPAERSFNSNQIAALLDKREPSRQAATGETLQATAALGLAHGRAADNSATWGGLFKSQVERCWKKPYGGIDPRKMLVEFEIRLSREGTLEGPPRLIGGSSEPAVRVYQESAMRAIIQCQPYKLPPVYFEEWKYFAPVFEELQS